MIKKKRMGNDLITILCFSFSILFSNEKRRIEGTGEAPTWQYYHEVDELLGSHADHSLDISSLDGSNVAHMSLNTTSMDTIILFRIHEIDKKKKTFFVSFRR